MKILLLFPLLLSFWVPAIAHRTNFEGVGRTLDDMPQKLETEGIKGALENTELAEPAAELGEAGEDLGI